MKHDKACDCVDCNIIRRDNTIAKQAEQIHNMGETIAHYHTRVHNEVRNNTKCLQENQRLKNINEALVENLGDADSENLRLKEFEANHARLQGVIIALRLQNCIPDVIWDRIKDLVPNPI